MILKIIKYIETKFSGMERPFQMSTWLLEALTSVKTTQEWQLLNQFFKGIGNNELNVILSCSGRLGRSEHKVSFKDI